MKRIPLVVVSLCALMLLLQPLASAQTIPNWQPNTSYSVGALVMFNGAEFKCIQAHTSQLGWEPPNVPALWQPVSGNPGPTPTPTPKPTPTPTPTPKPTPTPTPKPTPTPTPPPSGIPNWQPNTSYAVGALVMFNGVEFKCIQAHTSLVGWEPPNVPALWQPVSGTPGPTPTPTPNPTPTPTPVPPPPTGQRLFAPYIDMSLANNNLAQISQASGIKTFTLAFIIDNGGCGAGWAGLGVILPNDSFPDQTTMLQRINALRSAGGDVIISFGGANGVELGQACSSASALQAQYQAVINKYNVKMLDFDIEGAPIADSAAIDRRNAALAALQAANPGLIISYTLPVLPSGLTQDGVNLLANAKSHGVKVSVVNVMAMDYGGPSIADPNKMGQNAINATNNTLNQVHSVGLSATMGITPMIGRNDVSPEVFTLSDAQTVLNFAKPNGNVSRLAFWSVARDNGGCSGVVSPSCSGISQNTWDFSHIFEPF